LQKDSLQQLINDALINDEVLKHKNIVVEEYEALITISGGDARKLLNLLEIVINSSAADKIIITDEMVMRIAQQKKACAAVMPMRLCIGWHV
jgi:putative ATPase